VPSFTLQSNVQAHCRRVDRRGTIRRALVAGALALASVGSGWLPAFADQSTLPPQLPAAALTIQSDAHVASFAISADDVVVRTMTPAFTAIAAPFVSQFDGSVWAQSNCGPTSLAMALGAFRINVGPLALRDLANQQMASFNPDVGTSWESLAYAAQQSGASVRGLYRDGARYPYRTWSMSDLSSELSTGHPVLLLVRYWDLPGNQKSGFAADHYVVALGFNAQGSLIYNDPASNHGGNSMMTPAQLLKAWGDVAIGQPYSAMAVYR
jgi:peptidase C39-like protein